MNKNTSKVRGFTLVEVLVSLLISITVLSAGIQSSRSSQKASQIISDQLIMSGLADEIMANLNVLRYSGNASWKDFNEVTSPFSPQRSNDAPGLAISTGPSRVSTLNICNNTLCKDPSSGGPIVLILAQQNGSHDYSTAPPSCPVMTSWMPVKPCKSTTYEVHLDEIAVTSQNSVVDFSNTGVADLSTQLDFSGTSISDLPTPGIKKEFFDVDVIETSNISNTSRGNIPRTGMYNVMITLSNHADPSISYSRSQLLANTK